MAQSTDTAIREISRGISSKYPLLYVVSSEEERIERALEQISRTYYRDDRPVVIWSAARGFYTKGGDFEDTSDPREALRFIANRKEDAIYYLKDLPAYFQEGSKLVRALRDMYWASGDSNNFVVFSYPVLHLPEELKKDIHVLELGLPGESEILEYLRGVMERNQLTDKVSDEWVFTCGSAMRGLSLNEMRHLLLRIFTENKFDLDDALAEIHAEKAQVLMKESCLRVYPQGTGANNLGGLENLKKWVVDRKSLFTKEAYGAGIPLPSGVLFMGISGCGKSVAAKVIASSWDLQLVRLDMNLVLSGAYGPPEEAFDRATRVAETIAPIVLWIDEIENSFGYDEGSLSGGNVNIFSSFLTWMQEKPPTVFVAATANRIQKLPAEMIRKGRFDQVFFLDLPGEQERKEIFKIHIELNGGDSGDFDLEYLSMVTKEWSGAEIEQAVKSARIDSFREDRPFTTTDITRNTAKMVPLSKTMYEQVKKLRDWSFQRATPASN